MTKLFNGPKNSITDIDGFLVGNAHDENIKSGVTVLTRSTSFRASVSILGGAPGTKDPDLFSPDKIVENKSYYRKLLGGTEEDFEELIETALHMGNYHSGYKQNHLLELRHLFLNMLKTE